MVQGIVNGCVDFMRGKRQGAEVVNNEVGRRTRNPEVDYFERVDGKKVGKTGGRTLSAAGREL